MDEMDECYHLQINSYPLLLLVVALKLTGNMEMIYLPAFHCHTKDFTFQNKSSHSQVSPREGGGGLGIVVCNHASTFSSIHRGVQAAQTAINTHQIRDSPCVCGN